MIYHERDLIIRSVRDYFTSDIREVLVDRKEAYNKTKDFFRITMPRFQNRVKLYKDKKPLFSLYQLEKQIENIYRRRINLKSGGYIVIDPTEALVAIDVNSGRAKKGKDIEDTAFRTNMEAADEIARQLRLRDLGGLIAIDFIDMKEKSHIKEV
jgi:ribonuclease E